MIDIEKGSTNGYSGLGMAKTAEMIVKAQLSIKIAEIIKRRRLTQVQAAKLLGMSQPNLSNMLRGRGISEVKMMKCLTRLDRDAQIVVQQKHQPCVRTAERKGYSLMGLVWVESAVGKFLGFGRIELLERIKIDGSISAAARSMKMSYVRAWKLVHAMNCQAKSPLVAIEHGGIRGGGASLTDRGEKAVELFREFQGRFKLFLEQEINAFSQHLAKVNPMH